MGILYRSRGLAIVGGVQGMVQAIPAGFSLTFAMVARPGVSATAIAWGENLQRRPESTARLTLADDPLSQRLTYLTDGGSMHNFCDFYPLCAKAKKGCAPHLMHTALDSLARYHTNLSLPVGLYQLDPFWSHQQVSLRSASPLYACVHACNYVTM